LISVATLFLSPPIASLFLFGPASVYRASTGRYPCPLTRKREHDHVDLGQLVHAACRRSGAAVLYDSLEDVAFADVVYEGDGTLRSVTPEEGVRARTARGFKTALIQQTDDMCRLVLQGEKKEEGEGEG
jgi:hypothetical protein